jgi:uncharacterized membrane protein YoaK (UPF0700 family)
MSHFIARDFIGSDPRWAHGNDMSAPGNAAFILSCMLAAFASGLLNTLSFLGRIITVRATHSTATFNDVFLGLGFALRSRSLRYMWRVRLLVLNLIAHFAGGVAGSLVFASSFGASALFFPAMLLAPVWVAGAALLCAKHTISDKLASSRQRLVSP